MYDTTELRILEEIYVNPGIHKRQISRNLSIGMPSIEHGLKKINNLLKKEASGNLIKYFLDYSCNALTPALYCVEYNRLQMLPPKIKVCIQEFLKELKYKPIIAAIFGSYAKNKQTSASDIDILLIFQKANNAVAVENTAKKVSMRTNTDLSPIYLDYTTFEESFHDSRKKFFNNLRKNKILLTGIEWWCMLENESS